MEKPLRIQFYLMAVLLGVLTAFSPRQIIAAEAGAADYPSVAAVVGERAITFDEVMTAAYQRLDETGRAQSASISPEPLNREVLGQALEELIQRRLLALEGERIVADNEYARNEVEKYMIRETERAMQAAGGEIRFREILGRRGTSLAEYRRGVREDFLAHAVLQFEFEGALAPSPQDVREYYDAHISEFIVPEQLQYREIFIPFALFETPAAARDLARDCRAELIAGASFEKMARERSQSATNLDGGLCPASDWARRADAERAAIRALKPGEISESVESDAGLAIFRLDAVAPARVTSFEEAQEGIAKRLTEKLRREKEAVLFAELAERFYVHRFLFQ